MLKHHDQHIHVITSLCTNIVFCIACFSCKLYNHFFFGNLFFRKKMTVCVLTVFLAIFLSLLTYFFSCSVSQSLRVSFSSFLFFSIYFCRFLHYFCPHRTQKYLFATFVFETIFSACLQFLFYFFRKHVSFFPYKIGDAGTRSTDTLLRFNTAIRSVSNLTLRACKLHTPTN